MSTTTDIPTSIPTGIPTMPSMGPNQYTWMFSDNTNARDKEFQEYQETLGGFGDFQDFENPNTLDKSDNPLYVGETYAVDKVIDTLVRARSADSTQRRDMLSMYMTEIDPGTYVYTDDTYILEARIVDYKDTMDEESRLQATLLDDDTVMMCVNMVHKEGSFVIHLDSDTKSFNIMVPNHRAQDAVTKGLSTHEMHVIKAFIDRMYLIRVHVLLHLPRGQSHKQTNRLTDALTRFQNILKKDLPDMIKVDTEFVKYDIPYRYFSAMEKLVTCNKDQ